MITPTVGRIVWYRAHHHESGMLVLSDSPMAAMVVFVHDDGTVNLRVHDHVGDAHGRRNVRLVQEGQPEAGECCWMPYQKGQAAKAEQLEQKLADVTGEGDSQPLSQGAPAPSHPAPEADPEPMADPEPPQSEPAPEQPAETQPPTG